MSDKSVRDIITDGERFTLAALAARTASANGDGVEITGRRKWIFLLNVTASATDAGDTLDVYVDFSIDGGTTWINAVHFTQQAGNGAAKKEYAVLDGTTPGTSVVVATSDAASAAVRPAAFGPLWRARWAIADTGGDDASHTFGVTGYAQ